ncbi:DNA N-6-adenine-methyltransferase [Bacillus thuringiensis]|uniref:Bacteriophage DNA methylase n=1 Tax=Bacillus thuringiensis HD-771 TaxID=1218175 RepID=A0A9W3JET3_BACTU|nr:DNA N-6-adenine-methyltransferase [Bacillus thuringiensis]AFQ14632.1 bacteriophage DNA methylase [Bacillus thuringiensis HD-771]MEC3268947.1 DNA N-6-adenine-methyltransferase [Bacillus thuringiensis]MEC3515435.1 DNA N-6-adenine-methyltransferase [Bacillus thuringiensis]MED2072292.1 DNA N-6-adenine-methyltransferase [Bacillus thuringiensis]MED2223627.1 DNA N-6-adenine-methyltransferase [Bacillus thuringiensis]
MVETKRKGIGGHHSPIMLKDEWLTPKYITDSLGVFDLDPCSPINRPWSTAKKHYTILDDGLSKDWEGRVWCNPPYGRETVKWLNKLKDHGNGIALIFARTETKMFFESVWSKANAIFFFEGRLTFHHVDGTKAKANGGAPSVLVIYGESNIEYVKESGLKGKLIKL